jgi:hypothetical protein
VPARKKPKPLRRRRIGQWIKLVTERGGFLLVYGDELGQVAAYDQHGIVLKTTLGYAGERQRRLDAILRSPRRFATWSEL